MGCGPLVLGISFESTLADNQFCTRQRLLHQKPMRHTAKMIRTIEAGMTVQQMIAILCQRSLAASTGLQSIVASPGLPNLLVSPSMAAEDIATLPEAVWVGGAGAE